MPFFTFNFFGGIISRLRGTKKSNQEEENNQSADFAQKDALFPMRQALKEQKQTNFKSVLKRTPAETDLNPTGEQQPEQRFLKRDPSLGVSLEPLALTASQVNVLDRRISRYESAVPQEWVDALRRSTTTKPPADLPDLSDALQQFIAAENENLENLFSPSHSLRKKSGRRLSPSTSRHLSMSWNAANNAAETRAAANSIRNLQLSYSLSLITQINNICARRSTCATPTPEDSFGKALEGFVEDQQRVKNEALAVLEKLEPTVVSFVESL